MRLTCPNCGVEYEVPEGQVASGRHVQCTACHTRWFAHAPQAVSEDQILTRLENWSPRPRPVPVPEPGPAGNVLWDEPEETEAPDPPQAPNAVPMPLPGQRSWDPPKPADRPAVPQPAPVAELAPARPAPWLDLGTETAAPASRRGPNHFARGLVLVLALFALALGAYRFRADIAARLPAAAPALLAYGDWVDGARDALERRLGPLRSRG